MHLLAKSKVQAREGSHGGTCPSLMVAPLSSVFLGLALVSSETASVAVAAVVDGGSEGGGLPDGVLLVFGFVRNIGRTVSLMIKGTLCRIYRYYLMSLVTSLPHDRIILLASLSDTIRGCRVAAACFAFISLEERGLTASFPLGPSQVYHKQYHHPHCLVYHQLWLRVVCWVQRPCWFCQ